MILIQHLAHRYQNRQLFHDFSLEISEGEIVCLVGPSGCGKSTLLRLISGLESPDQGSIELRSNNLGIVFQEPRLLPWSTAAENVSLPARLSGRVKPNLDGLFALVRLQKETQSLFPHELSGGMKMRVALARALLSEPKILLMDEPLAALDEHTRFQLQEEISHLRAVRKVLTLVFVTHSVYEAAFLGTRAIVLDYDGRIAADLPIHLPAERNREVRQSAPYLDAVRSIEAAYRKVAVSSLERGKL